MASSVDRNRKFSERILSTPAIIQAFRPTRLFWWQKLSWFFLNDGSDGSRSGIGRKRNSSDPSDSDSVELPIPLTIPLFDLHWIVTLLALPIPSLVWTSPFCSAESWEELPHCIVLGHLLVPELIIKGWDGLNLANSKEMYALLTKLYKFVWNSFSE